MCFNIKIEEVKNKLTKFTDLKNFNEVENLVINGKQVFKDMNIKNFDPLYRVQHTNMPQNFGPDQATRANSEKSDDLLHRKSSKCRWI